MATVHMAQLVGAMGFQRLVAIKRMRAELLDDEDFVKMFLDEANVASKIRHPNVVPVLDVVHSPNGLALVQQYIHGVSLHRLVKRARAKGVRMPARVAVSLVCGILDGLHGAHEAKDDMGRPMGVVHRDVSPENVLVCDEGIAHILDFGIAKAHANAHVTRAGVMIGKMTYMAAEQMRGDRVTRAVDIYAAGVILWELLAGRRLHGTRDEGAVIAAVLAGEHEGLVAAATDTTEGDLLAALEPIVIRALLVDPARRYATADEMRSAVARAVTPASNVEVAAWVTDDAREAFDERAALIAEVGARSSPRIPVAVNTAVSRIVTMSPTPSPAAPAPVARAVLPRAVIAVLAVFLLAGGAALGTRISPRAPHTALPEPIAQPAPRRPGAAAAVVVAPAAPPKETASAPRPHAPHRAAPPPAPAPSASAADPAASECDVPFYYEGTKKMFKPACL
jgi:serine/threonine-protein kinase